MNPVLISLRNLQDAKQALLSPAPTLIMHFLITSPVRSPIPRKYSVGGNSV